MQKSGFFGTMVWYDFVCLRGRAEGRFLYPGNWGRSQQFWQCEFPGPLDEGEEFYFDIETGGPGQDWELVKRYTAVLEDA